MTQEELQLRHNKLVDLLRKMRGAQREYFKYRATTDLQAAKRYEHEVDKMINEEVKAQKSNQRELF